MIHSISRNSLVRITSNNTRTPLVFNATLSENKGIWKRIHNRRELAEYVPFSSHNGRHPKD